ncbi:hypothetical protein ME763_07620 [Streptomyces murinus]|uniref:hypothetical protein n=1 Tax=Streptomyces murinus TaxID=33900 RepID=UPI00117F8FFD|nr:hypothetical protein [Streptomyces murinus]WDO05531.1 hypothetical protein ME763_07620 [Streptomyces murinus]
MTNATAQPLTNARGGRMTMRVYTVDLYGTITQDRGTVTVATDGKLPPLPQPDSYPACQCTLCRLGRSATR